MVSAFGFQLLLREWPNVLTLLGGLIAIKTAIITSIGPFVGLSLPESVRIGLLLSQGGEFAFVVFSLANRYRTRFNVPHEHHRVYKVCISQGVVLQIGSAAFGAKPITYYCCCSFHVFDTSSK